jgi:hypothetical protein
MTSQLFKETIPMTILYDFLEKICVKDTISNWFVFSKAAFKKAEIYDLITNFKEVIKPYYYISKQYYIDRNLTFIRFTTIIKQICHVNNIEVTSKIVYNKSKYEMEYYIANNI